MTWRRRSYRPISSNLSFTRPIIADARLCFITLVLLFGQSGKNYGGLFFLNFQCILKMASCFESQNFAWRLTRITIGLSHIWARCKTRLNILGTFLIWFGSQRGFSLPCLVSVQYTTWWLRLYLEGSCFILKYNVIAPSPGKVVPIWNNHYEDVNSIIYKKGIFVMKSILNWLDLAFWLLNFKMTFCRQSMTSQSLIGKTSHLTSGSS